MSIFETVCLNANSQPKAASARASDHPIFAPWLERKPAEDCAKRTVILADDNDKILSLIGEILSRSGFIVHLAGTSASALEALNTCPKADLLLVDTESPSLDGIILADMIKLRCPSIRVIYMTDRTSTMDAELGVRHGPTLTMPFLADELVTAVRTILDRHPNRSFPDAPLTFRGAGRLITGDRSVRCP